MRKQRPDSGSGLPRALKIACFGLAAILCFSVLAFLSLEPPPNIAGLEFYHYLERTDERRASRDLAKLSSDPIRHLAAAAKSNDSFWSKEYERIWGRLPKNLRRRLPYPNRSEFIQRNALLALAAYGPTAKAALPVILEVAQEPRSFNSAFAHIAALSIAPESPQVSQTFKHLLQDPRTKNSIYAAIHSTHQCPSTILDSLLPLDWNNPSQPPYNGLLAISVLGPRAASEIPMIIQALENPTDWQAAESNLFASLIRMGAAASNAIPTLEKRLQPHHDATTRARAIGIIANTGPSAKSALPNLRPLLEAEDATLRCAAAYAIAKISELNKACADTIVRALETTPSTRTSWTCDLPTKYGLQPIGLNNVQFPVWFLAQLAPHPLLESAVPIARKKLLEEGRPWLIPIITRFLWRQSKETKETIPLLIKLLSNDQDPLITVRAADVLGEMGSEARSALTALKAARHNDLFTRRAAEQAIQAIQATQTSE